jgi:hypothetical protein
MCDTHTKYFGQADGSSICVALFSDYSCLTLQRSLFKAKAEYWTGLLIDVSGDFASLFY